jgi:hypothetical protein
MENRKKQMAMIAKIAGRRTLRSIQRNEGNCTTITPLQQEIAKNNNNYVIFCIKKEKTFYVY